MEQQREQYAENCKSPLHTQTKKRTNISGFLIVAWISFLVAISLVGSAWSSVSSLTFVDNPTMVEVATGRALVTALGAGIAMLAACFFVLMAVYSRLRS